MAGLAGLISSGGMFAAGEEGLKAAREEQTRKGLAKLMQGDQSALPQVYANDPQAAAGAVKFQGDQREAQMGEFAKLSTLYARTRDGNIYGQWARLGKQTGLLPADAPDAITGPADADGSVKFAEAVASAWGGQAGDTVQSRFVGEDGQVYALMRDGQVSPLGIKADPSMQIIEGAGGFYGVNRRNLQANPVQVGQPGVQSQQPVQRAPGEVPFAIDPSLPPEVQASIRADEQQWAAKPEMAIGGPMGGGQLQGKPKEASLPEETYSQPQVVTDPATGQQKLVQFGNRGGQRDVQGLAPPPTSRDAKPPTEGERNAAGYLSRMESAEQELGTITRAGYTPGGLRDHYTAGQGPLLNWAASTEGQMYRQQQEDWVRAKLRKESGAVIGDEEMEREIRVYFPQPGDSPEVIAQKAQSRRIAIQAMRKAAGRAIDDSAPAAPAGGGWGIRLKGSK